MVLNVSVLGSKLKKRYHTLAYHQCREAIAAGIVKIVHCSTQENKADLFTKALGPNIFERLTNSSLGWPAVNTPETLPSSTDHGELQKVTQHLRIDARPDVGVELDNEYEGAWLASAMRSPRFVRHMKSFIQSGTHKCLAIHNKTHKRVPDDY